jgi:hypothetical protein
VLPTSGKEFWSNQLKSLAAGNKILLHAYHFLRAVLQAYKHFGLKLVAKIVE